MKTLADFQNCISVPLIINSNSQHWLMLTEISLAHLLDNNWHIFNPPFPFETLSK